MSNKDPKRIPVVSDILENVGEQLKETGKSVVKGIVKAPGDVAQSGVSQVTSTEEPEKLVDKSEEHDRKEFVEGIYGKKDANLKDVVKKLDEEKEELKKLRQELHSAYYQREFNKPKPPEEKPAERVERQKMEDLRKEQKKKKPILVQRAQTKTEKYPGASG